MNEVAARVTRLQAAAWAVRRASPRRCSLPFALALMTDERVQADLLASLAALPPAGAQPPLAVVLRHYGLAPKDRSGLAADARDLLRRRGHLLLVAGGGPGDGAHNAPGPGLRSASVHGLAEAAARRTLRPHLALVSPVLPTRSHLEARALGVARAAAMASRLACPSFALGGLDAITARALIGSPFCGLAVLRAWSG